MTDLVAQGMPIRQLSDLIRLGEVSSEELVRGCLERIAKHNSSFNAFIQVRAAAALEEARQIDRWRNLSSSTQPLLGIPMSVKDLIETRDLPTTAGSRVFGDGKVSRQDATLVHRLRQAGAILLGKTNLHEFAYGVTNENSHFGTARNPWDQERIAGGSSGGSGVAVAAAMGCFSIGTDTRGSIRIPSSFCGITGLKGTLGSVPTKGVLPLSWTLDHVGPMTRSVKDAETVFEVIRNRRVRAGAEARDRKLKIGVCDFFISHIDKEIQKQVLGAIHELTDLGHQLLEVEIPGLEESVEASRIIAATEAAVYHAEMIGKHREGYDPAVLARLEAGFDIRAFELVRAMQTRERLRAELRNTFRQVDCLAGASVPVFPRPVAAADWEIDGRLAEVVPMVRLNAPLNMAGVPALVLPCGFSEKLPVALQLIAPWHREEVLFSLGKQYQEATRWHLRRPDLEEGKR